MYMYTYIIYTIYICTKIRAVFKFGPRCAKLKLSEKSNARIALIRKNYIYIKKLKFKPYSSREGLNKNSCYI